jgi:hypothetical protein
MHKEMERIVLQILLKLNSIHRGKGEYLRLAVRHGFTAMNNNMYAPREQLLANIHLAMRAPRITSIFKIDKQIIFVVQFTTAPVDHYRSSVKCIFYNSYEEEGGG